MVSQTELNNLYIIFIILKKLNVDLIDKLDKYNILILPI